MSDLLADYLKAFAHASQALPDSVKDTLLCLSRERFLENPHGDQAHWLAAVEGLPDLPAILHADLETVTLSLPEGFPAPDLASLEQSLRALMPWRKGPFDFFGVHIDTEWRSDWKWQRLLPYLDDLAGRSVLDVGCGSGYHCWRMAGAGASCVLGIDPTLLFFSQFLALKRYAMDLPVWWAPLKMEELPLQQAFDTVFSMGVLYHRRSPLDHLLELKSVLRPGGQLVLETLVIDGDDNAVLVPQDRYAQMRNVWFLPSADLLETWMRRIGFRDVQTVDVNVTSMEEQRATSWMTFQSLSDFLKPGDISRTVEGYPAPQRAIVVARI